MISKIYSQGLFVNDMACEPRTNQQLDAPAIFGVIKQWAADYEFGRYDARNEATCELAFRMVNAFERQAENDGEIGNNVLNRFANLSFPYI